MCGRKMQFSPWRRWMTLWMTWLPMRLVATWFARLQKAQSPRLICQTRDCTCRYKFYKDIEKSLIIFLFAVWALREWIPEFGSGEARPKIGGRQRERNLLLLWLGFLWLPLRWVPWIKICCKLHENCHPKYHYYWSRGWNVEVKCD